MYHKCVLVLCLAAVALARSTSTNPANAIPQDTARSSDDTSFFGDLKFLHKMYTDCAQSDLSTCLKFKLLTAMDRASRAFPVIELFDGVSFVQEEQAAQPANPQSENEIEATLPRALTDRENALNSLLMDRIFSFFQTHTLQVGQHYQFFRNNSLMFTVV